MKRIVAGILAHVDAGKTTLSEALLYATGQVRKLGRVDHGDAFLDTDAMERQRGITIFTEPAVIATPDLTITLLDTPGHVDFSAETERTLAVLDYAILVISGADNVNEFLQKFDKIGHIFTIEKVVSADILKGDWKKEVAPYQAVIFYEVSSKKRSEVIWYCMQSRKSLYITPQLSEITMEGFGARHLIDTPMMKYEYRSERFWYNLVKRVVDILLSLTALILLSPLLLLTALAIKLEDRGPVFYKQKRCTKNGEVFEILKFRSMIVDAEKGGKSIPCRSGDPRITRVGRVIRKLRIDEFPQIINVLKGDMSIVGPRPERIEHVEEYTKEIPEFSYRLRVKGGLTGYAQIYGKYNTSPYDKLRLDLQYIEKQSILLDLKLILLTIKIMFVPESTEGFTEEKSAQMTEKTKSINEIEE